MKRILLFLLLLLGGSLPLLLHAQGVKVLAPITPNSPADLYATHIDSLGNGGFMAVTSLQSRDNISPQRRKKGMLVYVNETDSVYQLIGGTANGNWRAFKLNSTPSASTMGWRGSFAAAPANPQLNWAYYNTSDRKSYLWDGNGWQMFSQDGAPGSNGAGIAWQGSLPVAPVAPQLNWAYYNTTDRKSYLWDGNGWQLFSQDGATGPQGPQGLPGLQGPQGATGANGIGLVWQGSLSSAPGSPQLNWSYYNTTDRKSYLWDGSSWQVFAQDGQAGVQGPQGVAGANGGGIAWQGSLPAAPVSPQLNWAYYNTTDRKSYLWDGSSWQMFSQDGVAGAQGPAGTNGPGLAWQGSLSAAPASPQLNYAYYNTTDKKSYVWDGSAWGLFSQDGSAGSGLQWKGSLSAAPASPELNWAYYNSTDKKSYLWDGSSWQMFAQDGSGAGSLTFNGSRPITLSLSPFSGMNPNTNDLAAWIEAVFYPSQVPTATLSMSFTNPVTGTPFTGGSTTLEMMPGGGNISAVLNWSAGRQSSTATLSTVTVAGASQSFAQPAQGASATGTATTSFARNTTTTFTNQVQTTDGKSASVGVTVSFSWQRYYGFLSAPPGVSNGTGFVPTNSDIIGLTKGFGSSRGFTTPSPLIPTGSQRVVIAYPLAWDASAGTPLQIWIGGLESSGGFQRSEVSLTNASGATTNYVVYVQLNNTSGNISFILQ